MIVKVLSVWGILSVFVSGFTKAITIGFPWAWAEISLANLPLLIPNLGVVAFLILLFIPFQASRCIPAGCSKGHAKDNVLTILLMFAAALVPVLVTLLLIRDAFQMMQWRVGISLVAFPIVTMALIVVANCSIRRISEELPDDEDGMRQESAGDSIRGLLVISLGCCSVLLGTFFFSVVFNNASADALLFVTSFVIAFVSLVFVIAQNPTEAGNCMKRAASAIALCGLAKERKGIASLALGTILVVALSAYIGCAGLTNEYVIRSIDEEQSQAYRVVAELGGGNCVAIPIKEENGEWIDVGSVAALNVFNGYQIIEEEGQDLSSSKLPNG